MPVLLVQLSDLHAEIKVNAVDAKWHLLCQNVVAQLESEITTCIIMFCGDAANTGQREQFDYASLLLNGLVDYIRNQRPTVDVKVLTIPGNHDCDLTSEDSEARVGLRRLVIDKVPAASISTVLLKAQQNYFNFALEHSGVLPTLAAIRPFYCSVDFSIDERLLRFHLINSA